MSNLLINHLSKIANFMQVDKKNYDNKINLILLKKIGKTTIPGKFRLSLKDVKAELKKIS